jgi:thymidine phosphorylase
MRVPPMPTHSREVPAPQAGTVGAIDNRRMARLAKLAVAPHAKCAGVLLQIRTGATVTAGEPLFTVHAESRGELDYALAYAGANTDIVQIDER